MPPKRDNSANAGGDASQHEMQFGKTRRSPSVGESFEPIVQETSRGDIEMRYYHADGAKRGVICVGGAGGGFDTPVCGRLYPQLCEQMRRQGIAALRVRYRYANRLEHCVLDVLAGINFLQREGIEAIALVGHSFGGAVVIQEAARSAAVRTCVALSTQTRGVEPARELGPRCSLLLAHGEADEILPVRCSHYVYDIAREPKRLLTKPGVHHGLDEWADELPDLIEGWIRTHLHTASAPTC